MKQIQPISQPYFSSLLGVLLLLASLFLAGNALADQESQDLGCPNSADIRTGLALKKDQLIKLKTGLEAFLNGEKVENIHLSALFMIDLSDANAVSRRVDELKHEVTAKSANPGQDPLLTCAATLAEFKAATTEIKDL